MSSTTYKGFTIRTFQDEGDWFFSVDEDGTTIATTMAPVGDHYRDGADSEGRATQKAKATINNLLNKGY